MLYRSAKNLKQLEYAGGCMHKMWRKYDGRGNHATHARVGIEGDIINICIRIYIYLYISICVSWLMLVAMR